MQRGDIVLVDLPQPAGASSHEQIGNRPALVVHKDTTSASLSVIMIVPMTSNLAAKQFPHTIEIQPSRQNGLSFPSILLVFQLRAIDKRRILKKLGTVEASILELVTAEMKKMLVI
jgi:mRNA interferase MazF